MENNNIKKYGIAIVALVVIGVGAWMFMSPSATAPTDGANFMRQGMSDQMVDRAEKTSPSGSLRSLLSGGSSQVCTFTQGEGSVLSRGLSYISNGKVRVDAEVPASAGMMRKSHMIFVDDTSYLWIDDEPMGMKFSVPANGNDTLTAPDMGLQPPIDLDDVSMQYDCKPWRADASYFEPPTEVMFHSMEDMMKGAMGGMEGMPNMGSLR